MGRSMHIRSWIATMALTCSLMVGATHGAVADSPWTDTRQVGPFVIQAEFPLEEYDALLLELPALEREVVRTLGIQPAEQPIYVYLFADAREHRAYLEEHHPQVPYRRALFIKSGGEVGVYAYRQQELAVDLRHECTHALLHTRMTTVPLWLDEGLAEYFEAPENERVFDHPHFAALRWNLRLGMIRSIAALEERQELSEMSGTDYRYAWAWVHFMLHGPAAGHEMLVGYLADAQRGTVTEPLSERLERAVPNSTEKMVQHFKYWHR